MSIFDSSQEIVVAAASYSTDLTMINPADGTDGSNATGGWSETNGHAVGAAPIFDGDVFIQGTTSVSKQTGQNATGVEAGHVYSNNANIRTLNGWVDGTSVIMMWWNMLLPAALESFTFTGVPDGESVSVTGGMFLGIGSAEASQNYFNVGGNDKYAGPYGGWKCAAIDPVNATVGYTDGNPGADFDQFSILPNLRQSIRRGQTMALDAIRWAPRGKITISGGTGSDSAATLTELSQYNDQNVATNSNSKFTIPTGQADGYFRLGLFQQNEGFFLWKGQLELTGTLVDNNKTVILEDNPTVYDGFTELRVTGTGAASFTNCTFINGEETGNGQGDFFFQSESSQTVEGCTFLSVRDFELATTLAGSAMVKNNSFVGLRQIIISDSNVTITGNTFSNLTQTSSFLVNNTARFNDSTITGNTFNSDGSNHAVEITAGTGSFTWNNTLNGYVAGSTASPVTPTSTGNEAIYIKATSGTVNIAVADGATVPSIRSDGATVNVTAPNRNFELTGLKDRTEVRLINSSTNTEIAGVENVIGGVGSGINNGGGTVTVGGSTDDNTFNYAYQYSTDTNILAAILSSSTYQVLYLEQSLLDSDKSIPVQQRIDRNSNL